MIKKMEKKDVEQVYQIGGLLHKNYRKIYNLVNLLEDEYTKVYVYHKENKIVGFIMYIALMETVDIIDIIVKEENRNQKIGSKLMDYIFSEISENTKTITLEVNVENKKAIHFYEKFDFEIIHTRINYYENNDAYLMGRYLNE